MTVDVAIPAADTVNFTNVGLVVAVMVAEVVVVETDIKEFAEVTL